MREKQHIRDSTKLSHAETKFNNKAKGKKCYLTFVCYTNLFVQSLHIHKPFLWLKTTQKRKKHFETMGYRS